MSEDYDDVTYGPITFERAKHHCKCLAVDCDWRASEVDEYVNAQAEMIARLMAEVRAWRQADARHDLTRNVMGDGHNDDVLRAMAATDATLAKHNNRL